MTGARAVPAPDEPGLPQAASALTPRPPTPPVRAVSVPAGRHTLVLQADHTVWWAEAATLFMADVHLGKDERFRRLGVPVPEGPTWDSLARLARACAASGARRLVVLGDLLHARGSATPDLGRRWRDWRATVAGLEVVLVRGNHDRQSGDPPADWQVQVVAEGERLDGLRLCHEPPEPPAATAPADPDEGFVLAGHVHPGVRLQGRAGDRLRLPCFVHGPTRLVLPAFGSFTGLHLMSPSAGERRYAVCEGRLAAV